MFNYLQKKGLLFACLCLGLSPLTVFGQACDGQEGALPDTPVEVGGDGSVAGNPEVTCFYFRFDSDITGWPTGITMDLWHEYEGDLGIFIEACGERLNVLQRPGAVGNCDPECAFNIPDGDCGSSDEIGSEGNPEIVTFFDTGTEPDDGIAMGGTFGLTQDDVCGVGTVTSFAELWSGCPEGLVEAEICFADHASLHRGFVSNLNFIFPNPYTCGCLDEDALNYDEDASVSSGDCIYECQDWIVEVPTTTIDLCQGADTLMLSATAPEADNPTFEWVGTGNSNSFLENAESAQTAVYIPEDFTGTIIYTVTAMDEYLCPQSEAISITVSPAATVDIGGPTTICGTDSTNLVLSGGPFTSIQWSTGAQTDNIRVAAGSYEVTVTADGLCPATDIIDVIAFITPDPIIAGPDTICYTDTIQLTVDTNFVSYTWSTGDTLSTIQANQPISYALMVVDSNGCMGVDTFQLTHFDSLQLLLPETAAFCPGDEVTLAAPADLVSYLWSNGDTTVQTTTTTPGLLSLTAVDSSGCNLTQEVQIEALAAPQPQIIGPPAICPDQTVELITAVPYATYEWSDNEQDSILITDQVGTYSVSVTDEFGCIGTASYQLVDAPQLDLDLDFPDEICPEAPASIEASTGFETYEWSTGDSTLVISVPGPGDYQVTATSPEGCVQSANFSISPYPIVPPEITGDSDLCPDETTVLEAATGYSNYVWGDGTTGDQLQVDIAGTYTLSAIDSNGCAVAASYDVAALPAPQVEIVGDALICENGTGALQVSSVSDLDAYTWSVPGQTTENLSIDTPGAYSVTVIDDNGCQASASAMVGLSIPVPQILGDDDYCLGESTVLMVADTFATYQWSGGGTSSSSTLTVDSPGDYTLVVTDALGCSGTATIAVAENALPEPVIGGNPEFCFGESTMLDAGAGFQSYEWSVPGNTTQFLDVTTADNFSVTVIDNNGCIGSAVVSTEVNPLPNPQIDGDLVFCQGAETELSSTEVYQSYLWSNGGMEQSTTVSTDEPISLTVVDENTCAATVSAQPDFFPVNTPQISGDLNLCLNGTTTLTADPGFASYEWSDGQSGPQATFDNAGSVTLTVVDGNGCVTERQALLNNYPIEPLNVIPAATFCAGESADLTAAGNFISYEWSSQDSTATITISEPGVYVVTATDANGCTVVAEGSAVEFALPEPEIEGLLSFCDGFNTTLSTTENFVSYEWSENSSTPEITIGTAGIVSVTVTDSNGCIGSTSAELETVTDLDPLILGPGGFCPGESVELIVDEPYLTYEWSNGGDESSISVNTPGTFSVSVTAAGGCTGETSVQVIAFDAPELSIVGQERFCAGEAVTLSANGDTGDLMWSTTSTDTEITVDEPGVYALSLIDGNGCPATDQITLTELPLPTFDLQGDTTFCAGLNTTLSTTPAFPTYNWSSGSSEASITLSASTDVSVTVTDDNGCSAIESAAVSEIVLPVADAGDPQDLDCDTDSVILGGDGSSNGSTFFYTWTGPGINAGNQNDEFPVVTEDGTYTLLITDLVYNCQSTASTVEVNDLSYTPIAVVNVTDQLDCVTSLVTVDGTGSDTGPQYVYEWLDENGDVIPGATDLQLDVNEAQLYTLVVIDTETACTGQDSDLVTIDTNQPVISFANPAELTCVVDETTVSATITASSGTPEILWTPGHGASIISSPNAEDINVNTPGWYLLEVTDPSNGCVSLDSVQVFQDVTPPNAVTNGDQMLFCNDESVTLNGQGSSNGGTVSYQWLFNGVSISNATNLQYAATEPGAYTLVVTNNTNGCVANSALDVSLDPNAPQVFELSFDPPTCEGDRDASLWVSNIVGGMSPYMYSFNGQGFSASTNYSDLFAGTYELTVEDANGCQLTSIVEIPDGNNVNVDLGPDQTIQEGDPVSIYPQVSIDPLMISRLDWNVAFDLPCPDCLIQEDLYLNQATRFFLKITDENGCSAEDNVLVLIEKKENIYVPNGFSPNGDGRNDRFYIFTDPNSVEEIEVLRIFNRWGEFVWENTNFQPNDPTQGWDGRVGGMDPNPAVFVWYAEIKMRSGEKRLLKGDVTLVE